MLRSRHAEEQDDVERPVIKFWGRNSQHAMLSGKEAKLNTHQIIVPSKAVGSGHLIAALLVARDD